MPTFIRSAIGMAVIASFAQIGVADNAVVVQLNDGRFVSGDLDPQTSSKALILRSTSPSIVARSAFSWDRVVRARHEDRTYSSTDFQKLAEKLRTRESKKPNAKKKTATPTTPTAVSAAARSRTVTTRPASGRRSQEVAYLRVEATVANWDSDAEMDGIIVHVFPHSIDGHIVNVHGTLNVKLVGRSLALGRTHWKRDLFPRIGEWSSQVQQQDFHRWGAVYRLPFQNVHPEFQLEIAPTALLTARLSIPGTGTFAASDANVVLRPYSRIRDESQLERGIRIFPQEDPTRRTRRR